MSYLMFLLVVFVFGHSVGQDPTRKDVVLMKLQETRYQKMTDDQGIPRKVDLWLKASDVNQSDEYNPDTDNKYYLFTRDNPTKGKLIPKNHLWTLVFSHFRRSRKTVVLIHGWKNTPNSLFNVHLIKAYLTAEDVNLIMTDWSKGAGEDYIVALLNCIKSAKSVADFIVWLNARTGAKLSNYHLIGHSLGGQQAAMVGRHLNKSIAYVTGLDPAMPGWIFSPHKFSPDVGVYTEVIHTDAGHLGMVRPRGQVDFYPNGGWEMPGCGTNNSCSHHRCVYYMGESLTNGGFTAKKCKSVRNAMTGACDGPTTLKMGGTKSKTGMTGIYFLKTNAEAPFSTG